MNKLWIIIQREYLSRVKKRSFLLSTIGVPLLIVAFYALILVIAFGGIGGGSSTKEIAVVDESGYFKQKLSNEDGKKTIQFSYPNQSLEELIASSEKDYDGILYIPKIDIYKVNDNIKLYSDSRIGSGGLGYIENQIANRVKNLRMVDQNVEKDVLDKLKYVEVDIQERDYDNVSSSDDTPEKAASGVLSLIGIAVGILLYFSLILFGTMVMKGVKEEKTNRIVEVIISSVKPFQLMLGKIIGISLVGLTQAIIWGFLIYFLQLIVLLILPNIFNIDVSAFQVGNVSPEEAQELEDLPELIYALSNYGRWFQLGISVIFYFLGGYFIYASLFSAVSSAVDDDAEAQKLMFPIMMPIIIGFMIVISMQQDPNSALATWASIIPLTSPIVMPARIPFEPPMWQIILSVLSLIAGVLFFVWISAKVYRTGVLMYGKKINFREIWKWIRY